MIFYPSSITVTSFYSFDSREAVRLLNYESLALFTFIYRDTIPIDLSVRKLRLLFQFLCSASDLLFPRDNLLSLSPFFKRSGLFPTARRMCLGLSAK